MVTIVCKADPVNTSPAPRSVAVIGGGIAGLAAARALLVADPGLHVIVYEGAEQVGGKLRTGEVGGVTVDLGAESILARRPEGVALAEAVRLAEDLVHPVTTRAGVWTRDAVRALPPMWMGIPTDPGAAARSGVLTRSGALRAGLEGRLQRPDLHEDVGIGRLVAKRMGREVRDRLVEPLLGGVYAGHADELSLFAAMPQLAPAIADTGSLSAAARQLTSGSVSATSDSPVFAGIAGGVGRLPVAVAADLVRRGGTVRTASMVRELERRDRGFRLVVGPTIAPEVVTVDAVVMAAPAVAASRLLSDVASTAARELGRIEYASVALVTLAFAASGVDPGITGSGFLVPPVDGRTIKASTFSSNKWGWLSGEVAVFRGSIGRYGDEDELQRPDTELVDAVAMDLREAVGLHAPLLDATVTRWGGALPQYAVGHLDRVERIRRSVAGVERLEICGAAFEGVGIPAVIADADAAATRLLADLNGTEE